MKTIRTARLLLRPLTPADADAVYHIYSDPRSSEHYPEKPIPQRSDTEAFIEKINAAGSVWTISLLSDTGTMIGDCALHDLNDEEKSLEIGGCLLPEFWGQGIMAEAFEALIAYAKAEWGIVCMIGKTQASNTQAIRLVEKLGFRIDRTIDGETILVKKMSA